MITPLLLALVAQSSPSQVSTWTVEERPVVRIGAEQDSQTTSLFRARWSGLLSDGRVAVLDLGSHRLKIFDAEGALLRSSGRGGQGPGELNNPTGARVLPGDSILVLDGFRFTVFDSDGVFARDFTIRTGRTFPAPRLAGVVEDGVLVLDGDFASRNYGSAAPGEVERPARWGLDEGRYALVKYSRQGELMDTLGVYRGSQMWIRAGGISGVPFGRSQETAARSETIVTGWSGEPRVSVLNHDGETVGAVVLPLTPLPISDDDFETWFSWVFSDISGDKLRETRARYRDIERPRTFPFFGELSIDRHQRIWVSSYAHWAVHQQGTWRVYDRSGSLTAVVSGRPLLRVDDVGSEFVLGRERGSLGEDVVVIYRIRPCRPTDACHVDLGLLQRPGSE